MRRIFSISLLILLFQACAPNPQKSQMFLENGIQLLYKSKFKEAVTAFDQAIDADANSYEAYYYRASAKFNLKKNKEAVDDYLKAIEIKPDYADAYFNLGRIHDYEQDYEMACFYYKKASEYGKPNIGDYLRRCN